MENPKPPATDSHTQKLYQISHMDFLYWDRNENGNLNYVSVGKDVLGFCIQL